LDWWPQNTALTFARPWLLLLLLAVPLLAYLRGKRGPAAALTFSSTSTPRDRKTQRRARRKISTRINICDTGHLRCRTCAAPARQKPDANRSERDRHHVGAGCFRLDVDQRFHDRWRTGDAIGCDPPSHSKIHRRPAQRSDRHHR